jgi:hypothetical protein
MIYSVTDTVAMTEDITNAYIIMVLKFLEERLLRDQGRSRKGVMRMCVGMSNAWLRIAVTSG